MVKKRVRDPEVLPEATAQHDDDGSGSDEDMDMINVEFEWFNMNEKVDFHGLKHLVRQLFDVDAQLFDLSALADLILSQPTIGSTVKVDGEETDPYAFITVLNIHEHKDKPIVRDLANYLLEKSKSSPDLAPLVEVLTSSSAQLGLVLAERLINIPSEIAPPMYTMLQEEIQDAVDDKEPYEFTHYLIWSKAYQEIASKLDQEDAPRQKKKKAGKGDAEIYFFHPEDEATAKHALCAGGFPYTKEEGDEMADSKRAFQELGVKPQGHFILIEAAKFDDAIKSIGQYINQQ